MRILLFDWTAGGHHPTYVRSFARALQDRGEIFAAVPDEVGSRLHVEGLRVLSLGMARPVVSPQAPLATQHKTLAEQELDLVDDVLSKVRPHHVVHLYSDPILRRLVRRPTYPCKVTLCLFFSRVHYPSAYRTPLTATELARAWFQELLVRRWRRRPDAHAVFTLDEVAARRWSERRGVAPAHWMPEPPIGASPAPSSSSREGCILYGALAPRKGVDLLTEAVVHAGGSVAVRIAGSVEAGFEPDLTMLAERMRAAGAAVIIDARPHTEAEGLGALARAYCAVLPYPRHYTMSRVMLEAASVGTPVLVHNQGMIAHLVRQFGIGVAVDCTDPEAFGRALRQMCEPPGRISELGNALSTFAARYSVEAFREAVTMPFHASVTGLSHQPDGLPRGVEASPALRFYPHSGG